MLIASLRTFDVMKGRLVIQRRRWQQYKDKAEENGSSKRQNATFKGRFYRENKCGQSWLQKYSQARSDIVFLSRRLYMYCSHGNKLMWQRHQAILRRSSLPRSVTFQNYQV